MRRRTHRSGAAPGCLAIAASTFLLGPTATAAAAQRAGSGVESQPAGDTTTFVVLGHLRGGRDGGLHYLLDPLLAEVRAVEPDFAVLTGDIIWGDPEADAASPVDRADIVAQWEAVDSALATLRIPVYRIPGNHDISDPVTHEVWEERYGPLPAAVDRDGIRLLLLNSSWFPDTASRRRSVRGVGTHLPPAQLEFLERQLADSARYEHAFVFLHHLLWWEREDSPWWREVHPLLARAGVDAVFSGDYGPAKFSHARRDGIAYYQSGIAPHPPVEILRAHEWNRVLAQQFDNYLVVRVAGPAVDVDVRTIGEVASGHFTPERWWQVYGRMTTPPPERSFGRERLVAVWEYPKTRWLAIGLGGLALGLGGLVGFRWGRGTRPDRRGGPRSGRV